MNTIETPANIVANAPNEDEIDRVLGTFDRMTDWDWQVSRGFMPMPNGRRRLMMPTD